MATYENYPTPPPTSSPKHASHNQAYDYPTPSPATQTAHNPQYGPSNKLPAQESYFLTSVPTSPVHEPASSQLPYSKPRPYPRRRSSPVLSGPSQPQVHNTRPFSPIRKQSPRPLYFSPVNPVPSPYSASRPQPRPGFLRSIAQQLEKWIKGFMRWSKENPISAGLLTFIPVMTAAGIAKLVRGLGKGLGIVGKGVGRSGKIGERGIESGGIRREEADGEWGWGLDHFKGFAGSKGGPFEGLLKIVQMLVNHYCKLTPSAVPRAASILMELYFLDVNR